MTKQQTAAGSSGSILSNGNWTRACAGLVRGLGKEDRRKVGLDLMRVQFGRPIGMPLVRSLTDGLLEVQSDLSTHRTARLLLCFHEGTLVVLHGLIRKTQKTVPAELALAKRRMKEITSEQAESTRWIIVQ